MGLPDLYPLVLPPPVIVKLTYLHDRIHAQRRRPMSAAGLRALIARLRQNDGSAGTN